MKICCIGLIDMEICIMIFRYYDIFDTMILGRVGGGAFWERGKKEKKHRRGVCGECFPGPLIHPNSQTASHKGFLHSLQNTKELAVSEVAVDLPESRLLLTP